MKKHMLLYVDINRFASNYKTYMVTNNEFVMEQFMMTKHGHMQVEQHFLLLKITFITEDITAWTQILNDDSNHAGIQIIIWNNSKSSIWYGSLIPVLEVQVLGFGIHHNSSANTTNLNNKTAMTASYSCE